nr:unnamed protein product [Callosobruchus chinensis]
MYKHVQLKRMFVVLTAFLLCTESDSESSFLEPQEAHLEEPLSFSSVPGPSITDNQQVSNGYTDSTRLANTAMEESSLIQTPFPGVREAIRERLRQKSIPEETIPIILASLSDNTSAFASVFNYTSEQQATLKRFFRGIYNKRPAAPRYSATWDPYPVLNYLSTLFPDDTLTLKDLTLKLVTLLLLTSGHRVQTLSKISVENITKRQERIEIRIPDRIKTSGNKRKQPFLVFPYFRNKPQLCVASTLEYYLTKTSSYRSSTDRLLLTHQRPFHAATTQSISRWVKEILQRSGIDTTIFKSHSVRHAATSAVFRSGLDIDLVRKTAGWSDKSTAFNEFYNLPLATNQEEFARCIINTKS